MQDYTDKHFRYLMRLLTNKAQLYTEMLVDQTLMYQRDHLEWFLSTSACEDPVVVQLGGSGSVEAPKQQPLHLKKYSHIAVCNTS